MNFFSKTKGTSQFSIRMEIDFMLIISYCFPDEELFIQVQTGIYSF